jgi:cytoskeletal protein CcmA (bactofilin family)
MAWMGQNPNTDPEHPAPSTTATVSHGAAPHPVGPHGEKTEISQMANIGKSLQVKGELSGSEDLTIDGTVEGKILLNGHNLTIGQSGRVTAEVGAKTVVVGGDMKGNITADDKVEVAATGTMKGDIRAPRVVLADGARFKGSIDMDGKGGPAARLPASTAGKPPEG